MKACVPFASMSWTLSVSFTNFMTFYISVDPDIQQGHQQVPLAIRIQDGQEQGK
jgi:hypothetical protein